MHGGSVTYLVDPGNNDSSSRTVVINYAYARDNETLFDIISVKMAAAAGPYKEMLEVVNACATRIRWRLSPASKRRLLNGCVLWYWSTMVAQCLSYKKIFVACYILPDSSSSTRLGLFSLARKASPT
ncbi:uncharacterized protein [Zea mays]|nr:uncharacterized protein LOC100383856 isoform X5 [Zea mays]